MATPYMERSATVYHNCSGLLHKKTKFPMWYGHDGLGDEITSGPKKGIHMHQRRGLVSKETVVLRRWGGETQNFGFINGVDGVNWPP